MSQTAMTASNPFVDLAMACFLFKQVSTALPIGFLYNIEIWIRPFVMAEDIKLKFGVSPFSIEPIATNEITITPIATAVPAVGDWALYVGDYITVQVLSF